MRHHVSSERTRRRQSSRRIHIRRMAIFQLGSTLKDPSIASTQAPFNVLPKISKKRGSARDSLGTGLGQQCRMVEKWRIIEFRAPSVTLSSWQCWPPRGHAFPSFPVLESSLACFRSYLFGLLQVRIVFVDSTEQTASPRD